MRPSVPGHLTESPTLQFFPGGGGVGVGVGGNGGEGALLRSFAHLPVKVSFAAFTLMPCTEKLHAEFGFQPPAQY